MASQGVSAVLTSRRARILEGSFIAHIEHLMGDTTTLAVRRPPD